MSNINPRTGMIRKHRDQITVILDMLSYALQPRYKSHIFTKLYIDWRYFHNYLEFLLKYKLMRIVSMQSRTGRIWYLYQTTRKGKRFLRMFGRSSG